MSMNVCDKCKEKPAVINLQFKTKSRELCNSCALKILNWIDKKPMKEQLKELWETTSKNLNAGHGIGGGI